MLRVTADISIANAMPFLQEIPDADADAIQTVGQAIEYISKTPEGEYAASRRRA